MSKTEKAFWDYIGFEKQVLMLVLWAYIALL